MFAGREPLKPVEGGIDPLAIARAAQPGGKIAMPGLEGSIHRKARPMQGEPERAHLGRAAREAVQDEDANIGTRFAHKVKGLVGLARAGGTLA